MTREEEIDINADAFADITVKDCWDWGSLSFGFEKGAKWADSHPNLTWQDIRRIVQIADEVIGEDAKMYCETPRSEEEYYEQVLKEFLNGSTTD